VAINLVREKVAGGNYKTLLKQNQPDGFDCPGCAWPDREHASTFEFCENGVKAVAAEATSKRVRRTSSPPTVRTAGAIGLRTGTARPPDRPDGLRRRQRQVPPIAWDDAFAMAPPPSPARPEQATFYTSGRTSNEAAFLFQLFVRMYGTNNFPDCSNMCHEPPAAACRAPWASAKARSRWTISSMPTRC
jgi:anaerobic selenocysteine-containing dehydrogenase